jgi:hypothetical protein
MKKGEIEVNEEVEEQQVDGEIDSINLFHKLILNYSIFKKVPLKSPVVSQICCITGAQPAPLYPLPKLKPRLKMYSLSNLVI